MQERLLSNSSDCAALTCAAANHCLPPAPVTGVIPGVGISLPATSREAPALVSALEPRAWGPGVPWSANSMLAPALAIIPTEAAPAPAPDLRGSEPDCFVAKVSAMTAMACCSASPPCDRAWRTFCHAASAARTSSMSHLILGTQVAKCGVGRQFVGKHLEVVTWCLQRHHTIQHTNLTRTESARTGTCPAQSARAAPAFHAQARDGAHACRTASVAMPSG